jgi:hypothetical protein
MIFKSYGIMKTKFFLALYHHNFLEFTFMLGSPLKSVKSRFHGVLNFWVCILQHGLHRYLCDGFQIWYITWVCSLCWVKHSAICCTRGPVFYSWPVQFVMRKHWMHSSNFWVSTVLSPFQMIQTLVSPYSGQRSFNLTVLWFSRANSLFHCVLDPFITIPEVCDRPDPPLSRTHSKRINVTIPTPNNLSFKNTLCQNLTKVQTKLDLIKLREYFHEIVVSL